MNNNLVMDAMRLAERAHRLKNQFRKAPKGEDRPSYFLHLVEVAWMLQQAGLAAARGKRVCRFHGGKSTGLRPSVASPYCTPSE